MIAFLEPAKPVIGISGTNADSASVRAMMTQIRSAGATPLFLGNHAKRDAAKDVDKIDALVVMGNDADIDPARYGQPRHAKTKPESDTPEGKARADYEYALMQKALSQSMPVLGVCGGMQRLNVIFGGDLHQDIPELIGHHEHAQQEFGIAPFVPVQPVIIDKSTMLGAIAGGVSAVYTPAHGTQSVEIVQENSMHHQAVNRVGQGLRASAFAADKLPDGKLMVEAIEGDPAVVGDQFVLGVQWHPEFGASELGANIAARLSQEAAKFAARGKRAHPPGQAQDETIESALPSVRPPQTAQGSMTDYILKRRAAADMQARSI
jgi:putative glutamine amidotransferase